MPIYMRYEGVDGDVVTKGYEKWIELESCVWGLRVPFNDTGVGRSQFDRAQVSVLAQRGASKLFLLSAGGTVTGPVVIAFLQAGLTPKEYYRYTLENVLISSYSIAQSSDDQVPSPIEMELAFTKMRVDFRFDNAKNGLTTQSAFWDTVKNVGGPL